MVKILHTADLHLDYAQYGSASRKQDFYNCVYGIARKAVELKVDAVLVAGDLLDTTGPKGESVLALQTFSGMLTEAGIPVLGIMGNHDKSPAWLKVCGIHDVGKEPVVIKGLRIGGLHFIRTADVFTKKLDELRESGEKFDIFLIHQAIRELFSPVDPLTAEDLGPILNAMGVRYVAMGDIHKRGVHTTEDGVVFSYPGSPERKASDDVGDKSVNLISIDTSVTPNLYNVEFVDTNPRETIHLTLETGEDIANFLNSGDLKGNPVIYVTYKPEIHDIVRGMEKKLASEGYIVRVSKGAVGSDSEITSVVYTELNKGDTAEILNDAVGLYFEADTDESQLIMQLMGGEEVPEVISGYLERK